MCYSKMTSDPKNGEYRNNPKEVKKPCIGCIYFPQCGSTTRTAHCDGRKTKREV